MKRLFPIIGFGLLLAAGCSHNVAGPPPARPMPPASISGLPPNAQSAVMSAVPPNELRSLPRKPAQ